jgi:hypothetical protein
MNVAWACGRIAATHLRGTEEPQTPGTRPLKHGFKSCAENYVLAAAMNRSIDTTNALDHAGVTQESGAIPGAPMGRDRAVSESFLVVFDYGQGGLWAYVRADSADAITRKYPELQVFRRPPDWMAPDLQEKLRATQTYELNEEPRGLLARILKDRTSDQ